MWKDVEGSESVPVWDTTFSCLEMLRTIIKHLLWDNQYTSGNRKLPTSEVQSRCTAHSVQRCKNVQSTFINFSKTPHLLSCLRWHKYHHHWKKIIASGFLRALSKFVAKYTGIYIHKIFIFMTAQHYFFESPYETFIIIFPFNVLQYLNITDAILS